MSSGGPDRARNPGSRGISCVAMLVIVAPWLEKCVARTVTGNTGDIWVDGQVEQRSGKKETHDIPGLTVNVSPLTGVLSNPKTSISTT